MNKPRTALDAIMEGASLVATFVVMYQVNPEFRGVVDGAWSRLRRRVTIMVGQSGADVSAAEVRAVMDHARHLTKEGDSDGH